MSVILRTLKLITLLLLVGGCLVLSFAIYVFAEFPSNEELRGCLTTRMYHVDLCPGSANYAKLAEISPVLVQSVLLSEDAAFWMHHGFDFDEIEHSLKKNMSKGKYARGGSTISQQLAKNLFLTEEKTMSRKFKEAVITLKLERTLGKKEILERYLNVVHWGKGIFGIQQAAHFYFNKAPKNLTPLEAAYLAFLLPSPEKYSRSYFQHALTPFAEKRLDHILELLYQTHKIDEFKWVEAKSNLQDFLRLGQPMSPPDPVTLEEELNAEPEDD